MRAKAGGMCSGDGEEGRVRAVELKLETLPSVQAGACIQPL